MKMNLVMMEDEIEQEIHILVCFFFLEGVRDVANGGNGQWSVDGGVDDKGDFKW